MRERNEFSGRARIALVALLSLAAIIAGIGVPQAGPHRAARTLGWVALLGWLLTLSVSPLRRLGATVSLRLRRRLGLTTFVFTLAHFALAHEAPLGDSLEVVWTWPTYRYGLVAMLALLPLAVTSFPKATRALRVREWQALHVLAVFALGPMLLHVALVPRASLTAVGCAAGLALALILARLARAFPRALLRGALKDASKDTSQDASKDASINQDEGER